jgi:hypothetical protein
MYERPLTEENKMLFKILFLDKFLDDWRSFTKCSSECQKKLEWRKNWNGSDIWNCNSGCLGTFFGPGSAQIVRDTYGGGYQSVT